MNEKVNWWRLLRRERPANGERSKNGGGVKEGVKWRVFIFLNIFKFTHDDLSLMSPQPRFHHHHQVKLFEYNIVRIVQVLRTSY
jgi:hypothetical protein